MAKAFQCDRPGCEHLEGGEPVAGVTLLLPNLEAASGSSARVSKAYELCSPCLASLRDWLHDLVPDPGPSTP